MLFHYTSVLLVIQDKSENGKAFKIAREDKVGPMFRAVVVEAPPGRGDVGGSKGSTLLDDAILNFSFLGDNSN